MSTFSSEMSAGVQSLKSAQESSVLLQTNAKALFRFKSCPEEFQVIEQLGFELSGSGEHLWLWLEKTQLSSDLLAARIAQIFEVSRRYVSYSGKKDRNATTRQWLSVHRPGVALEDVPLVEQRLAQLAATKPLRPGESIRCLATHLHHKKLQIGTHCANQFRICLRWLGTTPFEVETFKAALARIQLDGFPNYYGSQRFNQAQATCDDFSTLAEQVLAIPKRASRKLKPAQAWACSQLRAAVFNAALTRRIDTLSMANRAKMSQNFEQGWQTILPGDVAMRYPGHSVFQVDLVSSEDELATLQSRSRARELVVAGTLIGQAQKGPALAGLAAELQVAIDEQLGEATMQKLCALQTQSWRALWVWPMELSMSQPAVQDSIWLEFSLPAGAYATEFIRELERCYQT